MLGKFRPSPAFVLAAIALFIALGGTSYAAGVINGKSLANRSVSHVKLKKHTVTATEMKIVKARPMTLLNGWQPYAEYYDQPAYWKDALGEVHLKGAVAQPVAGSDVICTLPLGYRPQRDCNWPAVLNAATMGTIEIRADGTVHARTFSAAQASAAQAFTSLEGVSFRPTDP
jgi:hypothetical protein